MPASRHHAARRQALLDVLPPLARCLGAPSAMRTALAISLALSSVSALRLPTRAQSFDVHSFLTPEVLAATRTLRHEPISSTLQGSTLISKESEDHIHATMKLWDVQGVQVAVVRRKQGTENEWDVDVRAYGVKDRSGSPMQTDVSPCRSSLSLRS